MPQLKVKTIYIEKLKALGCYDKWLSNVKIQFDSDDCQSVMWTDWHEFINWSFSWIDTPEGHGVWDKIADS